MGRGGVRGVGRGGVGRGEGGGSSTKYCCPLAV